MLQLLLILASLKVVFNLRKRKMRRADDYPGVDPEEFRAWHEADLRFARGFPLIALGGFVVQYLAYFLFFILYVLVTANPSADSAHGFGLVSGFVVFLVSVAWIHSLYAASVQKKKEAGIGEPRASSQTANAPFLGDIPLARGASPNPANAPNDASAVEPEDIPMPPPESPKAKTDQGWPEDNIPSGY